MSKYGEPWKYGVAEQGDDERHVVVRDKDGERVIPDLEVGTLHDAEEEVAARIVACVNALAGRDPDKLAELEAAVEEGCCTHQEGQCHRQNDGQLWYVACRIRAALAAFRGGKA